MKVAFNFDSMITHYDLIIAGGGPIGLACGLEAQKKGLNFIILEKGCLVNSLYNYPGQHDFFFHFGKTGDRRSSLCVE